MDTEALRKNLPELRIRKGWSQGDLGRKADVRADTVSSIERGKHAPRPSTLRKLADALGVEVEDFFGEHEAPKALSAPKSLGDLRGFLEAQLGSSWLALPEDEWSNWWRGVSKEEAQERYRQIRAEWQLLSQEWLATHGKVEREPQLVPRRQQWGEVYFALFARNFEARFQSPKEDESEEEFRLRSSKGRAVDAFYESFVQEQHKEDERILRALVA